jgi:putative heme iron utilization protein
MSDADHRARAAKLLASARTASLGTLLDDGSPYVSFVELATLDGAPLLWISDLAVHARNLRRDARCSLLVQGGSDLASERVSFVGRAGSAPDPDVARSTFRAAFPEADHGAFSDFSGWRIAIDRARYIGGFGRIGWIPWDAS